MGNDNTGSSGMKCSDFFFFPHLISLSPLFLFYSEFGNHGNLKQGKKLLALSKRWEFHLQTTLI